jgi:hypothetical protein
MKDLKSVKGEALRQLAGIIGILKITSGEFGGTRDLSPCPFRGRLGILKIIPSFYSCYN